MNVAQDDDDTEILGKVFNALMAEPERVVTVHDRFEMARTFLENDISDLRNRLLDLEHLRSRLDDESDLAALLRAEGIEEYDL